MITLIPASQAPSCPVFVSPPLSASYGNASSLSDEAWGIDCKPPLFPTDPHCPWLRSAHRERRQQQRQPCSLLFALRQELQRTPCLVSPYRAQHMPRRRSPLHCTSCKLTLIECNLRPCAGAKHGMRKGSYRKRQQRQTLARQLCYALSIVFAPSDKAPPSAETTGKEKKEGSIEIASPVI